MPQPTPNSGESQSQFIQRCAYQDEVMQSEYPDEQQRLGVCYTIWEENKSQVDIHVGSLCKIGINTYKPDKAYQPRKWSTIDRRRAKYRAKHRPLMGKALDQSIQPILDVIDRTTNIDSLPDQNLFIDDEPVKKAYNDLYIDTGSAFAMFDRRQAQKNAGLYLVKDEEEVYASVIAEEMAAYAREYVGQNIKVVGDTSKVIIQKLLRDIVPEILEQGLGSGEAQTMLRDRIDSEWHRFKRFRTERIVRTETTAASNIGSLKGVRSTGIPHQKIWTAAFDERTREAHANANMQRRDTDKPFTIMGESLMHPGDPSGSAGNVINCFPGNQATSYPKKNIKKIFRSWYDGKTVIIELSSGKNFTCTPNHPILTTSGWKAAGLINDSDKLVKASLFQTHFSDFNINNIPSTFEKVFNSFSSVRSIMRVCRTDVNFYGDIPGSDVDIVRTKGQLRGIYNILFVKKFRNIRFKLTNFAKGLLFSFSLLNSRFLVKFFRLISYSFISFFDKLSFLFPGSVLKSNFISFGTIPGFYIINSKNSINSAPRNIEFLAKFKNGGPGIIHFYNLRMINSVSGPVKLMPKARINEYFSNGVVVDLDNISDFFDTHTLSVHSDDVISSVIHSYKGYVYTFETTQQIYEINSVIARNCRCALTYEMKR